MKIATAVSGYISHSSAIRLCSWFHCSLWSYKSSGYYMSEFERIIRWSNLELGIDKNLNGVNSNFIS